MTLSYDTAGAGPAVVLLHSSVCDRRMWDPQWQALLDAGYRLVRCDLRGYGDSPVPAAPHNDAEDVAELVDTLGLDQVALVGASYGGKVAQEFAARWPERVTAMALLCSAGRMDHRSPQLMAFGEREDALLEAGDITAATELNLDTWLGPDADEPTRALVRRMQQHAFEVQLAAEEEFEPKLTAYDIRQVKAPTLLVTGAHDFDDFRRIAVELSERLADARHLELPWAGHLPSLERPLETNALLLEFLAQSKWARS